MQRLIKSLLSALVCLAFLMISNCTSEDIDRCTTPVSFDAQIKPILETNCIKSGCHNGDNGTTLNWSVFANVQAKAELIKTKTTDKSMPADKAPNGLPQEQIDLIACWVNQGAKNN